MDGDYPKATTLEELLVEIRTGYNLYKPILIEVEGGSQFGRESTVDNTMTLRRELDWAEQYGREYARHRFRMLGANTLPATRNIPVTVGRSRKCDMRIENDSVSKVHASILFDRSSGEYFVIDEHSRNGTCINGEPVTPGTATPIWSGAYISYGDAVFVFIDPPTLRKLSKLTAEKLSSNG